MLHLGGSGVIGEELLAVGFNNQAIRLLATNFGGVDALDDALEVQDASPFILVVCGLVSVFREQIFGFFDEVVGSFGSLKNFYTAG